MRKILFIITLFFAVETSVAQSLYFPPTIGNTWDTLSASSLGWCTDKVDTLYNYLESRNTKAFILLKDGKIVYEKYFGTFTADSIWYWASAGKSLTSFIVGIAQQESLLSINDLTSQYIGTGWTSAPIAKENQITIRNQLSMTTGLDDGVADSDCTIDTCLQYLADPGARWSYHNAPYTLLDSVLESAAGITLNAYMTQKIKNQTGITGSYIKVDFNNVFFSKPRSMARFGLLMLNKGTWDNTPILTDTTYYNSMINSSQNLNLAYGYLWWLNGKSSFMVPSLQTVFPGFFSPNAPSDMYAALGKNGQMLNIVPSQNLIWVRMGDAPNTGSVPFLINDTIWQKLNQIMCVPNKIVEKDIDKKITCFPSPAGAYCNIVSASEPISTIEIYNALGQCVLTAKPNAKNYQLDVSSFKNGVFYIKYSVAKTTGYTSLIVLK